MDDLKAQISKINASGLFDCPWYLRRYPDVAAVGLDPVEHFVRWGSALMRDPNPGFSTMAYRRYLDAIAAGPVNPLLHFVEARQQAGPDAAAAVDVLVPVFNALPDVRNCLHAVLQNPDGLLRRLIVVNDASDAETTAWLRDFAATAPQVVLIEHATNQGYTRAINSGLCASHAGSVVTLNSDTVVTPGWLSSMHRCLQSSADIGAVGPLSNAASWQNVPALYDDTGGFAINLLPESVSPAQMAALVREVSLRIYPRLPFLNGFCMMIRRRLIEIIGPMDEARFPVGYGEENDFCLRAAAAGFTLAVADDAYVFHAKSRSFGHARRKELSAAGRQALELKHDPRHVRALIAQLKGPGPLETIRNRIAAILRRAAPLPLPDHAQSMRVLFLLPVKGGGGGAHSVVQEALGMQRQGITVQIAVTARNLELFLAQYGASPETDGLFVATDNVTARFLASRYDVVIATIYTSMQLLRQITEFDRRVLPAYYVQDYEPLFFERGTESWISARQSYGLLASAVLFAKTHWIIDQVRHEHAVPVRKVAPSLDHDVYRPGPKPVDGRVHIAAMIRPQTPRRGAERTMRVFAALHQAFPGRLHFILFGCAADDPSLADLPTGFSCETCGILTREQVASVLARSHIFTDLSDYQAFGRTALEAMACGCAAVLPLHGGANEYAIHGANAVVVDTGDEEDCIRGIASLAADPQRLDTMAREGIRTASLYAIDDAVRTEIQVLATALEAHRQTAVPPARPRLHLVPSVSPDGQYTPSAYVRLLLPCSTRALSAHWDVSARQGGKPLPEGSRGDIALLQRQVPGYSLRELKQWAAGWRKSGGKIAYDLDDDLLDIDRLRILGIKHAAQTVAKVEWLLRQAQLVTVPTPSLQAKVAAFNPAAMVLPSRLDATLWRLGHPRDHDSGPAPRSDDVVRIGYIGPSGPDPDLGVVTDALQQIQARYADRIEIEIIGGSRHHPPPFGKRVPPPYHRNYPDFVDWLQTRVHWDIGLLPLAPSNHHSAGFPLRFLEYAALDLAIVCSASHTSTGLARHGETAWIVPGGTADWVSALTHLIEHAAERHRLATTARQMVSTHHVLDRTPHLEPTILRRLR